MRFEPRGMSILRLSYQRQIIITSNRSYIERSYIEKKNRWKSNAEVYE